VIGGALITKLKEDFDYKSNKVLNIKLRLQIMKRIMRLSSSTSKKDIELLKDRKNYILFNPKGLVIAKCDKNDENGAIILMQLINTLIENHSWLETLI